MIALLTFKVRILLNGYDFDRYYEAHNVSEVYDMVAWYYPDGEIVGEIRCISRDFA